MNFNEDFLIAAPDYADVLTAEVLPFLDKIRRDQTVTRQIGFPLFCSIFPAQGNPLGTVLVLHGFTENTFKYSELIYSLVQSGYTVLAYDQRGHGKSGRDENLPDPSVTHVDHFSDYVEDLRAVCEVLLLRLPRPWFIFAHSMGGAVASLYLEKYPNTFSAAALCAPMIAPNTGGVPPALAAGVCRAACFFGRGKRYPFFMKPYSGPEQFEKSCASDPARFAWYDAVKANTKEYQNSIPSYRWTVESIHVTKQILAPGAPESIRCPVLLSTADQDFSVMPEPQKRFIDRVPRGKRIFVPASRHEIFRSTNDVFFPWWRQILSFLKEVPA